MEQQEQLLLEPLLDEKKVSRSSLLPVWMKVFIWIFMITGAIAPICLLAGLSDARVQLALYGLETTDPLSTAGLVISLLFLYKGIVAYSLWTEKDWAINFGIVDALVGIAICVYVMAVAPLVNNQSGFDFNFRLELVALIPYLIKLQKMKLQWQRH
jgi:hypothetical protein